ncbi:MAG: hypothetical protein QW416_00470 [Candidatus Nitrosocaldaceae archaeon]
MEYKYIAVYCKSHKTMSDYTISNILRKAKEVYSRLVSSYTNNIKILIFGINDINKAYEYLPREMVEEYDSSNIEEMSNIIWSIIKKNEFQSRVYIIAANWQWKYIEQLLKLKDERYKFFFEGALDARTVDELKIEEKYEKYAKVRLKEKGLLGLLDGIGSNISTDLKG